MIEKTIWIIPLLPLLGFLINGTLGKVLGKKFVSVVAPGVILLAFLISCQRFVSMLGADKGLIDVVYSWISIGEFQVNIAFQIDRLSGLMLLIVTGVGFLIHLYSIGYMYKEEGYYRYFSYLNLFIFFMLLLILGNNFLVMFLGWEGVGLCSYLLIGYYVHKKSAGDAAKKAFIANRVGDFGFIAAMLFILSIFGTLNFDAINIQAPELLQSGIVSTASITIITLLLFLGACGKSAQIPLFVWLPDAMEGPTPVSALIHAATMVTSGLYMIARLSHLFVLSPTTMTVIATVGAITALFAATIAIVQNDIKKVLAYSTVSQLGYMFLAMGVGAFSAGIFHVMTHAFFKALLFLGSGSVIHAMHHEQDMRKMGGLKKHLPVTWITFAVGTYALAGLPFGAGFFSKDEILWKSFSSSLGGTFLWGLGSIAAVCTAFYMYRLVNLTFYGKSRVEEETLSHLHESPWTMLLPLCVLAVLSAFAGFLAIPHVLDFLHVGNLMENYFHGFFATIQNPVGYQTPSLSVEYALMIISITFAVLGLVYARFLYNSESKIPLLVSQKLSAVYKILLNKYYLDELYEKYIYNPIKSISTILLWKVVDIAIIDGFVNGLGNIIQLSGERIRKVQNGVIHQYALVMMLGIVVILGIFI